MSKRILIADDDEPLRQALEQLMEMEGFAVASAPDGQAVLELAGRSSYDLILLDVQMPNTSGLEALPALHDLLPGVPVIMMSAEVGRNMVTDAQQAGACDFILKPFNSEHVLTAVRRALALSN